MRYYMILALTLSSLCITFSEQAATFELIRGGQPQAVIVLARNASSAEVFAAEELQTILRKISGAAIRVQQERHGLKGNLISIGRTSLADRNGITVETQMQVPDPFRIISKDNILYLIGQGDRGTIYSVYHFAEYYLGCRWYGSQEWMHEYPQKKSLAVEAIDDVQIPAFKYRIIGSLCDLEVEHRRPVPHSLWALRTKMNLTETPPDESDLSGTFADTDAVKYGGVVRGIRIHGFADLLPADKFFRDHPEYFDLQKEKRIPSGDQRPDRGQFCTSNPEVQKIAIKSAKKAYQKAKDLAFFSLTPNDNWNFCQCAHCTALDWDEYFLGGEYVTRTIRPGSLYPIVSDRLYQFLNKVAEAIYSDTPDNESGADIFTLAYNLYVYAPKNRKPHPRIVPAICHMRPSCYAHPVTSPFCPENKQFADLLRDWAASTPNLGYYAYFFKTAWKQVLYPVHYNIARDLQFLHELGFRLVRTQGTTNMWGHSGLNYYVFTKYCWDAEQDYETLRKDYMEGYYREAAEPMDRYFRILETSLAQPHVFIRHWSAEQAPAFLTPEVMMQSKQLLEEAQQLAQSDRVKRRVQCTEIAYTYTSYMMKLAELIDEYEKTGSRNILKEYAQTFDTLENYVEAHKDDQGINSWWFERSINAPTSEYKRLREQYRNQ